MVWVGSVPDLGAGETLLEAVTLVCCDKALECGTRQGEIGLDMRDPPKVGQDTVKVSRNTLLQS